MDANAERREEEKAFVWGEGADMMGAFEERSRESEERIVGDAKTWRGKKFAAGFGWITGPKSLVDANCPGRLTRPMPDLRPNIARPTSQYLESV